MTDERDRDILIEQVAAAWRPTDLEGGPRPHPAWHDLDEAGRAEAFELAVRLRRMEAGLDPQGLSTTGRAVLDRILRARGA
jgi:hypothetical protein